MNTLQTALADALKADAAEMTYEEWVAPETSDPWNGLARLALLLAGQRLPLASE